MALLMRAGSGIELPVSQLTLAGYLSLPDDTRAEIVAGVLRPMVRSGKKSREVQRRLATALAGQKPQGGPDPGRGVVPGRVDLGGGTNYTHATDAMLVLGDYA